MDRVLILGVGNILWADEGFGPRCIEALAARFDWPESVELMDGGTQGLLLIEPIQLARRVLLFDAIDYDLPPGSLHVARGAEISTMIGARKLSLHQATMQDVLACTEMLGGGPEEIVLVGVQPAELEDYGGSLSAPARAQLEPALAAGLAELARWGIVPTPRSGAVDDAPLAAALTLDAYEAGRPSAEAACRVGDARVLALAAAAES